MLICLYDYMSNQYNILNLQVTSFFMAYVISMSNYYKYLKYKTKYYNAMYGGTKDSIDLHSIAFKNNEMIPEKYTCDGMNMKIPLVWSDPPNNTKSFAITIVDYDAPNGKFVHWIAWNINPSVRNLDENFNNYISGNNSANSIDYIGPCPPYNHGSHKYVINIFALDMTLDIDIKNYNQLKKRMQNHILGKGTLIGKYARNKK